MESAVRPLDVERTRGLRAVLPRYVTVGSLSVLLDVGLLALLHSALGVGLLAATTLSFAAALVVNYTLNHVWAFDAEGMLGRRLLRYAVLVGVNYGITLTVVAGLTAAGSYYLVAKSVAVLLAASVNFAGYRLWVFR